MSSRWPLVPLGEVLGHRKEFIAIDDFASYKRCRVQLHAQGVVLRDTLLGAEIKTKKQQVCRAGEFLVAEIDAKVGGFGIVPTELDGAIVSSHYFLFPVKEERLDRRFLGYFIRTPAFRDQVAAQGSTNYAAIRPQHVLNYVLPLPPLAEQRQLVERIDALAAKIEEARALRAGIRTAIPLLRATCARRFLEHPVQATKMPLRDLVEIRGGGTPSKGNPLYWDGKIPWVSPKDMKQREINDAIDHISEEATRNSPAKVLPCGAVLIVVRGMILVHTVPAAVLRVPAAINQDMKALVVSEKIIPEFLCEVLWAKNRELLSLVEKSTHDTRKLETSKLLDFVISVPTIAEQRQLLSSVSKIQERGGCSDELQERIRIELDAMLPAVLHRAFRGELLGKLGASHC